MPTLQLRWNVSTQQLVCHIATAPTPCHAFPFLVVSFFCVIVPSRSPPSAQATLPNLEYI